MDPLRLAIAALPLSAYFLLLTLVNLRRRPLVTSGGSDLAALGIALTGLMFVGPIELFRPLAASARYANFIWLFLVVFYWLCLSMTVLLLRPRLVLYNVSREEIHPVLAEAAARVDSQARWLGDSLTLPRLGVQMHLDCFPLMRNVSLVSSGDRQDLDGWRQFARAVEKSLGSIRVKPNPRAVGFGLASLLLFVSSMAHLLSSPTELAMAIREVLAY